MTNYAVSITQTLKDFAKSYNYDYSREMEKKVHEQENLADANQHKILNYLIKDFVPPLEREDIIVVTRLLDDVIDNIDEVSIDLDILSVKKLKDDFVIYMCLLEKATSNLKSLFEAFKNMKNYEDVKNLVIVINRIEEDGDRLFQNSIRTLYSDEKDPIEVIRWTAIYNRLEDCFDSIEHVSEYVEEMFMKNS